jgi:hypothetical protein
MRLVSWLALALLLGVAPQARAVTFLFATDPFAGTDALTTPGRQIVGGESSVPFSPATDVFAFEPAVFGAGDQILFANGLVGDLPTAGVNVVVLQTLDNDGNPASAFGAGTAATLIAERIVTPGPGFFVYFNSGLDLPRLVFSIDLSDGEADLKVLARITNLTGQSGALATFSAANFAMIPEPSSLLLVALPGALAASVRRLRSRRVRR